MSSNTTLSLCHRILSGYFLIALVLCMFPTTVTGFGIPKRNSDGRIADNEMVLPSAVGLAAVRSVGRRSKRLIAIQSASPTNVILSMSATTDQTNNENVPITPSPKKTRKSTTKKAGGESASAVAGRKRKRPSAVSPDTVVSRKLDLEDGSVPSRSLANMVENNELEPTTDMVASINPSQKFIDLEVPPEELRPSSTLTTGQCFHWRVVHPEAKEESSSASVVTAPTSAWGTHDATEWVGTLRLRLFGSTESVVLVVRELPDTTLYRLLATTRTASGKATDAEERDELHRAMLDYFQLDVSLPGLYEEWSVACPRLSRIADCIPGVRIIRQDPWECLISFICSSNNNIPRITKMLASIRKEYGRPLLKIPAGDRCDGKIQEYHQLYSFPSLEDFAARATDEDLRGTCGMGYRAGYVLETMKVLREKGGEDYLRTVLRTMDDPQQVQDALCEFKGVGRKVADCVALFSLNQEDAIPVDTHVWNIAIRDYDPDEILQTTVKSLTPTNYKRVGDLFRFKFPNRAGWAHSLLFVAELPSFRGVLPNDLVDEMEAFQKGEKERKKKQKEQRKKK